MGYEVQLCFFQRLLKGLQVSSCIVDDPSNIPPQIDLGLRANLFALDNYAPFLEKSMGQAQPNTVYRFFDEYDCHYIFMRLPDRDSYFYIGPYLLNVPSRTQVDKKMRSLGASRDQMQQVMRYYADLPVIDDENLLLTMANSFAAELWGESDAYSMEYVEYVIPDRSAPIPAVPQTKSLSDSTWDLTTLEQNYANERHLMEAVSKGKLHLLTALASTTYNNGTEPRLPDSLRDRKNYMVILKTLLRKAAEYGGVHPLHIHRLSSYYADQIENIRTMKQSLQLQNEMVRSFCLLVKRHSLNKYSYLVGQVITQVQFDLSADHSLKAIAGRLNVNASYLSTLFHKEYGCTITEFVNRERINHAIKLLETTQNSVQQIAAECGIQDTNYFIKIFKKQTGMTPTGYREKQKK